MHRRTPACVERSMASDPDRRSVVPPNGGRQQERGRARCPSQPSPGTCAPRRSPSFSMCHQRRSVAGRRRVGCPSSVPWAATDATPTPRSGPCWKPCPSYPQSANRPPRLTAPAPLLSVARRPFRILRSIGILSNPGTADFLRARDRTCVPLGMYIALSSAVAQCFSCYWGCYRLIDGT